MRKIILLILTAVFILSVYGCKSIDTEKGTNRAALYTAEQKADNSIALPTGGIAVKTQAPVPEPVTVTYSIDENNKEMLFSQNNVKLKTGQLLVVEKKQGIAGDTILGGDFYNYLDVESEYSQTTESAVYYFKGMTEGNTLIEFSFTKNSEIKGRLNLKIEPSGISNDIVSRVSVTYRINSDTNRIELSNNKIELEVGQKLMLVPDESVQNTQITTFQKLPDELSSIEIYDLDYTLKRVFIYKAEEPVNTVLEFAVAHAAFIKGELNIVVK